MKKISILPQHIYSFSCPKILVASAASLLKSEEWRTAENHYASTNTQVLAHESLKDLKAWVKDCLQQVGEAEEFGDYEYAITQSWGNWSNTGDWHHRHRHGNSILSGILYLTDSKAETWFSMASIWPPNFYEVIMGGQYYPPEEVIHKEPSEKGKLIVFPSTLDHSVNEHKGDEPRLTLSFNAVPTGEFGDDIQLTKIVLNVVEE
jgi:hypothetical protein